MLSLQWRLAFWLIALAALAFGIDWALNLEGVTRVAAGDWEIEIRSGVLLLASIVFLTTLLTAFWLLLRGVSGVAGVWAFFSKRRRRKGLQSLSTALVAIAEGDGKKAIRAADQAEGLLDNPDLTRLVTAQAAALAGDDDKAERYYAMMADDRDLAFLGVSGLMRRAVAEDKIERALVLAERAHALRPRDGEVIDILFRLQSRKGDWMGARETVRAAVKAGRLTRDVGDRRRAVLHVADAISRDAAGDDAGAYDQGIAAVRLTPGFAPAAATAARLMQKRGEVRGAARVLIAAWRIEPHPDLAAGYAALDAGETPEARQRRFERLFAAKPDDPETKMMKAEIALAAEDYEGARTALGDVADAAPSARACALMAAVEQGQGADPETVRAWLAKAASAPRGAAWVCDACGAVTSTWSPICEACGAFDSYVWRPVEGVEGLADAALFPLLSGDRLPGRKTPANGAGGAAAALLGVGSANGTGKGAASAQGAPAAGSNTTSSTQLAQRAEAEGDIAPRSR